MVQNFKILTSIGRDIAILSCTGRILPIRDQKLYFTSPFLLLALLGRRSTSAMCIAHTTSMESLILMG